MKYILLLTFCCSFIGSIEGQISGNEQLPKKQIAKDIEEIEDMIDDMEGYKNKAELVKLVEEYRGYLNTDSDTSSSTTEQLHEHYVVVGETLLGITPDYDSTFHEKLKALREDYDTIVDKTAYKVLRGRLNTLKKEYEIEALETEDILKAFRRNGKEGRVEISLGDILREIGGIMISMNEYAEEFGNLNKLTPDKIDALKRDPAKFIAQITQENGNKHWALQKAEEDAEMRIDYLQDIYDIQVDSLRRRYEKLDAEYKNLTSEYNTFKAQKEQVKKEFEEEQQQLNQEQQQAKKQLNEENLLLDLKSTEYDVYSTEVDELKAKLDSSKNILSLVQSDLDSTEYSKQELQIEIDSLNIVKAKLDEEKETLTTDKKRAENGRLLFLITSIALLLTMLGFSLYDRWQLRKEKETLSKNLKYKSGFYEQYIRTSKADIAIQREKLEEQRNQLKDYLRELNHRTRNNLQIISSILGIQIANVENGEAKAVLSDTKKRIQAIGLIHRETYTELYKTETPVKMQQYVDNLLTYLKQSFQYGPEVIVEKEVENVTILPDKALPIGLIINEVVTNSFKHAFPGNPNPRLKIMFKHRDENRLYLSIKDNGKQKGNLNDDCLRKDTMGIGLIRLLTKELEGEHKYNKNGEGFKFAIQFPIQPTH